MLTVRFATRVSRKADETTTPQRRNGLILWGIHHPSLLLRASLQLAEASDVEDLVILVLE